MILPLSIIPTLLLLAFGLRTNASPILSLSVEARADSVPVSNEPRGLPLWSTLVGFVYLPTGTETTLSELIQLRTLRVDTYFEVHMKRASKEMYGSPETMKECRIYSSKIDGSVIKKVLVEPSKAFGDYSREEKNKYLSDNKYTPSTTVLLLPDHEGGVVAIPEELLPGKGHDPLELRVRDCMMLDKVTDTGAQTDWKSWNPEKMKGPS